MTSHELARKLLSMEDLPVTVRGYEGGVDIVETVSEPATLMLDRYDEWYYGKHEYFYSSGNLQEDVDNLRLIKKVQAIHLGV